MRKPATALFALAVTLLAGATATPALAEGGKAPSSKVCGDKDQPPTDAVTLGGCVAIAPTKGNCHSCHMIQGINYGNIAPPLVAMKQRFADKAKLRAQVWDASVANPKTVMPPFGRHGVLSETEIDQVVEFLLTL